MPSDYKSNLVDLEVGYRHHTASAVLINDGGKKEVWVPFSIAEFDPDPRDKNSPTFLRSITVTVPEWFAKKEGLI